MLMLASRRPLLATACAVALGLPGLAVADSGALSSCNHLLGESEQLACYDKLSSCAALAPVASAVSSSSSTGLKSVRRSRLGD
jgi:hypothetical protein